MSIYIYSLPKAGTYFFAAFLAELGFEDTGLHIVERQPPWPVASTILAGEAGRKTGMPVWRAVPPAA